MLSLSFNAHLTLEITLEGSRPRELKIDAAPGGNGKPSAGARVSRYLVAVLKPGRPPVFNRFVTCGGNCDGISCAQPSTSNPIVLMAVTRNVLLQTFRLVEHRRRLTISINSINNT